jgi:hypothetical protein
MDDPEWMYMGRPSWDRVTSEWMDKTEKFLDQAFDNGCPKGCVLFRKEHKDAKYCPKCKSSRYAEVDNGDG